MNDGAAWILRGDAASDPRIVGGKAAALAALAETPGAQVPAWFVLRPEAALQSLDEALRERVSSGAAELPADALRLDASVRAALEAALAELAPGPACVAVRSSALDEDGAGHSFAGQFESYLFCRPERVAERVVEVWRSAFAERVRAYRAERGLAGELGLPAVIVQRMVDASAAGVAFSADPVTGRRDVAVVSAVRGLGSALVGGEIDADTFRVDRAGTVIERILTEQTHAHRADPDGPTGVRSVPLEGEELAGAAIDDARVREVAALARACARARGPEQDIEWAVADDTLFLLQSRPITSLARVADPQGRLRLWDNSNIVESYRGITTPLTYSFARHAYEGVYRQFCALLGVPRTTIDARASLFANMIGLVRGRVFYNLLNWYRMLALLPGFRSNRAFMEQMMGVREGLPAEIVAELEADPGEGAWKDRLRLGVSSLRLVIAHLTLGRTIAGFERRLDQALRESAGPYADWRLDRLADAYRDLEARLLLRWDAPLVNDFLAMIFFGVLGRLGGRWCNDATLHNDLVSGEGGVVSAEPASRVRAMAAIAADDRALVDLLCEGPVDEAVAALEAHATLGADYTAYLARFGDRCREELKLESLTLDDDPTPLVRAIGHTARRVREGSLGEAPAAGALREDAERRVREALTNSIWKPRVFAWVLRNTRRRVRDRENLRFERTRLFGRVRRIFLEMGQRLVREGRLDDARDVFLLTVDELVGFCEGSAVSTDLRGLVTLRRREFDTFRNLPAPSDRFETHGAVHVGNTFVAPTVAEAFDAAADLQGLGCCPGVVRGRVRVVRDPLDASLRAGEILVAESTDPGWILLFPLVSALLVERGSLLSHSAIVAREMGIAAIVSIPRVTERLHTGDEVEMNGSTGSVRILARADGSDT